MPTTVSLAPLASAGAAPFSVRLVACGDAVRLVRAYAESVGKGGRFRVTATAFDGVDEPETWLEAALIAPVHVSWDAVCDADGKPVIVHQFPEGGTHSLQVVRGASSAAVGKPFPPPDFDAVRLVRGSPRLEILAVDHDRGAVLLDDPPVVLGMRGALAAAVAGGRRWIFHAAPGSALMVFAAGALARSTLPAANVRGLDVAVDGDRGAWVVADEAGLHGATFRIDGDALVKEEPFTAGEGPWSSPSVVLLGGVVYLAAMQEETVWTGFMPLPAP